MLYVGNTFDKKVNKGYKTIKNAKKEAEKNGLSVWDEEGVKLYPLKVEVTDDVPDDAALEEKPDGSVNAYDENGEKVGEVPAEEVKEIMDEITAEDVEAAAATDDVPDDAALEEKPDGSVNAYDENGEKVGEVPAEEVKKIMDEITAEDVEAAAAATRSEEEVHGTIRRVFDGRLRLRRRPSFEDDAICGVTMFDEKNVEKKAKIGDRVLYKTTDGYWISGDPEHTEFIPEE
ncbi:MAG: hypothetical protein [Bacteriophage sp.]|jgi:hypothetical protein|nr:MAG: hypothetical protein [Bacteriophage sp.]